MFAVYGTKSTSDGVEVGSIVGVIVSWPDPVGHLITVRSSFAYELALVIGTKLGVISNWDRLASCAKRILDRGIFKAKRTPT